jgi:hypothetical protein
MPLTLSSSVWAKPANRSGGVSSGWSVQSAGSVEENGATRWTERIFPIIAARPPSKPSTGAGRVQTDNGLERIAVIVARVRLGGRSRNQRRRGADGRYQPTSVSCSQSYANTGFTTCPCTSVSR